MASKLKDRDPLAFLRNYSADDLKQAISFVVAELAKEYAFLREAREHPRPLTEEQQKLLDTQRKDLTTVDLTQWRICYWEGVQDRLWNWYRHGQANEPGGQGEHLWDSVCAATDFDPAGYVLLEDACRTADLIAQLQEAADRKHHEWVVLVEAEVPGDAKKYIVKIDALLSELRQQRLAMRNLLNQLGIAKTDGGQDTESRESKGFWESAEKQFKEG